MSESDHRNTIDPHADERAAFMRAIIAEPLDNMPRYAYCDALIEWGEDGESARIQAAIESGLWWKIIPWDGDHVLISRRGFVGEVRCKMAFWMQSCKDFTQYPLEVVTITDKEPYQRPDPDPERTTNPFRLVSYHWSQFDIGPIFKHLVKSMYFTREAALADFSQACIKWMRS